MNLFEIVIGTLIMMITISVAFHELGKQDKSEPYIVLKKSEYVCTEEREELYYVPQQIGKVITQSPRYVTVCVTYKRNQEGHTHEQR